MLFSRSNSLLQRSSLLGRAADPARPDVDDRGVDAELGCSELQDGALHEAAGTKQPAGANVRRGVGHPALLERELVEQRLDPRPLDDGQLGSSARDPW